jgi:ribose 5-phosphate isomerase A
MNNSSLPLKEQVALQGAALVTNGNVVGIGSGSTVELFIKKLAERVTKEKLSISCVTTSYHTSVLCRSLGLSVLSQESEPVADISFDGADEVDANRNAIKGRGAAMLREKINACHSKQFVLLIDESKRVKSLGEKFSVPVQVLPSMVSYVTESLKKIGATLVLLRPCLGGKDGPVFTEEGHLVLDAKFNVINESLSNSIKQITGVVEHGIFWGLAKSALVATSTNVARF